MQDKVTITKELYDIITGTTNGDTSAAVFLGLLDYLLGGIPPTSAEAGTAVSTPEEEAIILLAAKTIAAEAEKNSRW